MLSHVVKGHIFTQMMRKENFIRLFLQENSFLFSWMLYIITTHSRAPEFFFQMGGF
jgi:hypothetical protein